MQASDCMEQFKTGLTEVKERLGQIQRKVTDVDKDFYFLAQQTI